MTSSWVNYIRRRIAENRDFLLFISGPTGSGKSWYALKLAEELDPNFTVDQVKFYLDDILTMIESEEYPAGSVFVFDEFGVANSSRDWQSEANKAMSLILQTVRHRNYIFIFTAPNLSLIDNSSRKLIHAIGQMRKINYEKETSTAVLKTIQYNEINKVIYFKLLRKIKVVGRKRKKIKINSLTLGKPSVKLIADYEPKKKAFTSSLYERLKQRLQAIERRESDKDLKERVKYELEPFEEQVYELMQKGMNHHEIGEALGVKWRQINANMTNIKRKIKFRALQRD